MRGVDIDCIAEKLESLVQSVGKAVTDFQAGDWESGVVDIIEAVKSLAEVSTCVTPDPSLGGVDVQCLIEELPKVVQDVKQVVQDWDGKDL